MLKYNYNEIPQNTWDKKAVSNGLEECEKIVEDISVYLKSYIESYHNRKFDLRSVNILLGNWIRLYVSVIYDRSLSIKKLNNIPAWLKHNIDISTPPFDYHEFGTSLATSENYNRIIYQVLFQTSVGFKLSEKYNSVEFCIKKNISPTISQKLKSTISKVISRNEKLIISNSYISWRDKLRLAVYLKNYVLFDDFHCSFKFNRCYTFSKRFKHSKDYSSWSHDNIYLKLLPYFLPTAYFECYESICNKIKSTKNYKSQYFFTSNGIVAGNPFLRTFLSNQKKIKILNRFHGGGYEIWEKYHWEDYERKVADSIYCFGKKTRGVSNRDRYLSPAITNKKSSKPKNIRALFIISSMPKYVSSITYQTVGIKNIDWFNNTLNLLKKIKDSEVLIKPYPAKWAKKGDLELETITRGGRSKIYNGNKSALFLMGKSRLILHNQLTTTFLESIGMNIPTICFYDEGTYSFSSSFQSYEDKFREQKIFISSLDECEKHYREIYENPNTWWFDNKIQEVVKSFQSEFFNISDDWRLQWLEELNNTVGL